MARLSHAWRALSREQRLTALAAGGLFFSMFLPWYSKTDTFVERGAAKATQTISNAFQAFSFVEAAVLLVSAAVLAMLFARAERRTFQLPGGDGLIVTLAGGWTAILIFYRLLDKPGLRGNQRLTATVGVEWGIFIALLVALGLLYTGTRLRALERTAGPSRPPDRGGEGPVSPAAGAEGAAQEDENALVSARPGPQTAASAAGERVTPSGRPRYPPPPPSQMSFEEQPPEH
ncbi:MAG TPA: hypothetical protein VNZ05_03380 [Solirubrobacteraceae bacterium]|jgi:hypothetical protein|nr:hypothetical protein [Solirubrobacteraceae bacterium]